MYHPYEFQDNYMYSYILEEIDILITQLIRLYE